MLTKNIVFLACFTVLAALANGLENPYWRYVKDMPLPYYRYFRYPLNMEMPLYRYTYPMSISDILTSMKPTSSIQLPLSYPYGLAPYAPSYASPALLKEEDQGESGYIRRYSSVLAPTVTPMPLMFSEASTRTPIIESSSVLSAEPIIADRSPAIALPHEKLQDEVVGPSGYIATFSGIKK